MSLPPWQVAAVAALLGFLATWLTRAVALRLGIVNRPNPIVPQHVRSVAYLGGVGIGTATAATLGLLYAWEPATLYPASIPWRLLAAGAVFLVLGVLDDLTSMSPAPKFLLQAGAACLAVFALGVSGPAITGIPLLDAGFAVFWILTLVNAFNLTDVCDGLVGGLAVISLGFLALLLPQPHSLLALIAAGASLGFLALNRPPATIFLGDAGSHFLGFLVAALSLHLASTGPLAVELPRLALLAVVPLFELVFLTVVRVRKGLPWWRGSPDHFSLRLQAAGFSRWQTDAIAWSVAFWYGIHALTLPSRPVDVRMAELAILLGALLLIAAWLKRHEVPPG